MILQQIYILAQMHYFQEKREPQIQCKHCHKHILLPNYPIHQIRCVKIIKKHQQKNEPETCQIKPERRDCFKFQQKKEVKQEQQQIQQIPLIKKQQVSHNPSQNDEEKIPCFNCGYLQTLEELDSHPSVCTERAQECSDCQNQFPRSLMSDHKNCCSGRRVRNRSNDRQTRCRSCNISLPQSMLLSHLQNCPVQAQNYQNQQCPRCHKSYRTRQRHMHNQICEGRSRQSQSDWVDEIDHSVDQLSDPQFQEEHSQDPFQQAIRELRYRPINQNQHRLRWQHDRQGYSISRQIYNPHMIRPNNSRMHNSRNHFQQIHRGEQARDLSERMAQLIRHMINIRQEVNDKGLTNQQIQKLQRVKYDPKGKGEKDLCTICYCEFDKDDNVINLRCNHQYHSDCIIQWLRKMANCPLCKRVQTDRQMDSDGSDYEQ